MKAASLNYRDVMVIKGWYNPKLGLPATPDERWGRCDLGGRDGGGTREGRRPGDVALHRGLDRWAGAGGLRRDDAGYAGGGPGRGAEWCCRREAVVPIPAGYDFAEAATLPIAALTAWSALRTVTQTTAGHTILTLGTGGVSIFALQFAKADGRDGSSSPAVAMRSWGGARGLCADHGVNYRERPDWDQAVLELTGGVGVDLVVENGRGPARWSSLCGRRGPAGRLRTWGALTGTQERVEYGADSDEAAAHRGDLRGQPRIVRSDELLHRTARNQTDHQSAVCV